MVGEPRLICYWPRNINVMTQAPSFSPMPTFTSLDDLFRTIARESRAGPVAVVWNEDDFGLAETIRHLSSVGFFSIIVAGTPILSEESLILESSKLHILSDHLPETFADFLTLLMPHLAGRWVHPCFNGEFLFFPFSPTRKVSDALAFAADERRASVFGLTLDLYCDSLDPDSATAPLAEAMFDDTGYFPENVGQSANGDNPIIDVTGGLRWRISAFVPEDRRSISRVCAFRAGADVSVSGELRFDPSSIHEVSTRWHHSLTMTVASFRAAKALRTNPDSMRAIGSFQWKLSRKFDWTSEQLMKSGLMEPGQWF